MTSRTVRVLGSVASALVVAGLISVAASQEGRGQPGGGAQQNMGEVLMEGLRGTPGCLGVDAGQMMSGRNSIIAWFENKEAVKRWYDSEVHQGILRSMVGTGEDDGDEPLAHVEDEEAPIMVIATITFARERQIEGINLPISQISIELYAPLPGGAFYGSRLAPAEFEVPHMRDFTAADAADGG